MTAIHLSEHPPLLFQCGRKSDDSYCPFLSLFTFPKYFTVTMCCFYIKNKTLNVDDLIEKKAQVRFFHFSAAVLAPTGGISAPSPPLPWLCSFRGSWYLRLSAP